MAVEQDGKGGQRVSLRRVVLDEPEEAGHLVGHGGGRVGGAVVEERMRERIRRLAGDQGVQPIVGGQGVRQAE